MMFNRQQLCVALAVTATMWGSTAGAQITGTTLSPQDIAEIKALQAAYGPALLACQGDKYADLFALPGGYFGSSSRGEVRERQDIIDMVIGYDRCTAAPAAAPAQQAGGAGRGARPAYPEPVIEWAPEGAKTRMINSRGGGYYDDVYVRTPKGWKFKSRNVVADAEVEAKLTTQDFIEIRNLAGDDHGHYANVYGEYKGVVSAGISGQDKRSFRSAGLHLEPAPGGVKGYAFLRDNGGRYDDFYVRTPQGWRIKERKFTPPAAGTK